MKTKTIGAAAVIRNEKGHILLVKHSYGPLNWELPGGGAEENETVMDTALREVREETGLLAEVQGMSGIYYESGTDSLHSVFLCRESSGADPCPDRDEILECAYWSVDDLPRPMYDFTVRRIQDAVSGVNSSLPVTIASPRTLVNSERTPAVVVLRELNQE